MIMIDFFLLVYYNNHLQVTLDCAKLEQRTFSIKNVWSVGVASVPRVYDLSVNNPGINIIVTITLYRPVRATSTLYPIGRPLRVTITLYIG